MLTKSIANLDFFKILDEETQEICYGSNQGWYATEWQRRSGCGPSAATNIIQYLKKTKGIEADNSASSKKSWLAQMEEIWEYVTPTPRGIPTTELFYESVLNYAKAKGIQLECSFLDLPEDKSARPELSAVLQFLEVALLKDAPIAFLNLCNGEEENLHRWHWVTIISLEYNQDGSRIFVRLLDEGLINTIDLVLWYNTTMLGGGFVYFI